MSLLEAPTPLAYILLGVLVISQLPRFGRAVLAFMRDLDDYREKR